MIHDIPYQLVRVHSALIGSEKFALIISFFSQKADQEALASGNTRIPDFYLLPTSPLSRSKERPRDKMSAPNLYRYIYFYQSENALAFAATTSGAALVIDRATAGLSLQRICLDLHGTNCR